MFQEFVTFLSQYNVVWIAVWLLIASKAWELVRWLIEDLITPVILGPVLKRLKVKNIELLSYKWILYGKVISTLIDFIITALIIFLFIKYANISVVPAAIK
jgi:large conductance mechanosensitive channel